MSRGKDHLESPRAPRRRGLSPFERGWLSRRLALLAVLAFVGTFWALWEGFREFSAPGPLEQPTIVVIAKGAGMGEVGRRLAEAGVVKGRWLVVAAAKLTGLKPKAGEYLFSAAISAEGALVQMAEGRTVIHKLTIAEGLTVRRVLADVNAADYLAGEVARPPTEGSLLPETWYLSRDDQRDEVVARMEKAMRQALDAAWAARAPGLPLKTKEDALVLASIVERETALASERPHVAAVFENRLRRGMRLQSDPTVIYGLSEHWGVLERPLVHGDLAAAHPWNTYVIDGLPPTPIANPGKASLDAVLHPMASEDLYFVADGGGGHVFAATLQQHNANVAKWRKIEGGRHDH